MERVAKSRFRSVQEAAFARCYQHFWEEISRPVKLAEILFSEGIITSETKTSITSDEDERQIRSLLDAVQNSLSWAKDTDEVIKKLTNALEEIGVYTGYMQIFIDGKQNWSVKGSVIKGTCPN